KARGQAQTWPQPRAFIWRGLTWSSRAERWRALVVFLKEAAALDFGPGRLFPWMPVAFGLGIALYFGAEREPSWVAAVGAFGLLALATACARRRPVAFPAGLLLSALAAGFAMVSLRAAVIEHPVIDRPA